MNTNFRAYCATTSSWRNYEWDNERSDYIEFTSEFAPLLERIPGRWYNAHHVLRRRFR